MLGGRSASMVLREALEPRNYAALWRMWRRGHGFRENAGRYFLGRGDYPYACRLRTPCGEVAPTLYSQHDMSTVNEVFFREDYAAGAEIRTVVDIGSNIGISALYFLTRNDQVRCRLYEPVPRNVERLRANLAGYEDRYEVQPVAVAAATGRSDFGVEETGRYGGIGVATGATIEVECVAVTDVLEDVLREFDRIDVLKLDTEGSELEIFGAIPAELLARVDTVYLESEERPRHAVPFTTSFRNQTWALRNPRRERDAQRWVRFAAGPERDLNARPRVHRFAAVPLVGEPGAPSRPLAVWIDAAAGGDDAVTRASLERQTAPAARVLDSPDGADWTVRVVAGDVLAPEALERLGQAIELAPDAAIVTCDDDLLDPRGRRHSPLLRPGPSPDLWRARDPQLGLFAARGGDGGASPYRLLVELGGPDGERHAHVPLVLCHRAGRRGPEEPVGPAAARPAAEPAVEAIVCFRDRPELLERCARSLLERTAYERLTLRLVDNGSAEPATAELLAGLGADSRVTVDRDPGPFNFSALNDAAASRSDADVLVFLNSDTEVVDPGWVDELLAQALRPEVGAVAPLLTYPDGRVQHAGAVVGMHGWAGHPFAGLAPEERTPFGAAADGPRNWLAVSAACMMVERAKYAEAGGFDAAFAVGGGDVDLCLRLTAAGRRSLCVPGVRLLHDESATRDPAAIPSGDFEASRRSYGAFRTVGDPFYHPALTLDGTGCEVRAR
jgi:FkbM family methyltransferase